jgi:hypothetical protein
MISVSVVSVPLSRAHPLTVIVSFVSAATKMKFIQSNVHFYALIKHRLPKNPAILMQDVAGNSPSRPFLPPMHGDSKISVV